MNENISPANIGGMGPISLPSGDAVGSGDVPAGKGDAKKKKKKKDKMLFSTFNEFVSEEYEAVGKYNTVKKVIKELGRRPSEKDVAEFIMKNYKDVTGKELRNSDPESEDKIADIVAFYKFDVDDWEEAMHYAQNESLDEAKIKDARKDLGYVAFLKEMSELNSKDLQKAYDAALEVLEDKGMSEKQAIGFLNSPHGKYMGEYVVPGMDYSHEAFLDKLDEYYNERMLKKYAKDYANLGESLEEGFFSRLFNKRENRKNKKEVDKLKSKIEDADVQGMFQKSLNSLTDLDNTLAALDAASPDDVDNAFSKYRKSNKEYIEFVKVLKGTHKDLANKYGEDAFDELGASTDRLMKAYSDKAENILKKLE